ncbi:MAG TPA: class I SAM-dependent methyltransferase [Vicinamibacterales bacterium]|nr:class I SAM-dependent methyltransferase [Vicinamibacterales bacterium]
MALVDDWIAALETRHRANLTSAEFLKAVRALSARYVERRAGLADRSPLDSAGKRAAFAAYYAPLHFLTTREAVRAVGAAREDAIDRVVDLGCGTGAASAAWALEFARPLDITGIDEAGWALTEAAWTWRTLGLRAKTRRGDLVDATGRACRARGADRAAFLFAWSVNELAPADRDELLDTLSTPPAASCTLLVIEPLARSAAPWWDAWVEALRPSGAIAGEWHFDVALPPALARIDEAAGFRRNHLGARTLWRPPVTRP